MATIRSFNLDPPVRSAVTDREREIAGPWRAWATEIGRRMAAVTIVTVDVSPPGIAAGGFQQATVSVAGVQPGVFVQAAYVPGNVAVVVHAECVTAGQVVATFHNVSGSLVSLASGTLRLRIDGD